MCVNQAITCCRSVNFRLSCTVNPVGIAIGPAVILGFSQDVSDSVLLVPSCGVSDSLRSIGFTGL